MDSLNKLHLQWINLWKTDAQIVLQAMWIKMNAVWLFNCLYLSRLTKNNPNKHGN